MAYDRFSREQLIWKALCALDEVAEEARFQPVLPSAALRFALAFLYSESKDPDRSRFDEFWKVVRGRDWQHPNKNTAEYMRGSYARTLFEGIARSVGIEATVEVQAAIRRSWRRSSSVDS